jgi:geranylgeranyl pyrophosphate synthase
MTKAQRSEAIPMFADFNDFTEWLKPKLAYAFKTQLSNLTGGIALMDSVSFESALAGGKMIRGCLLCLITNCLGGSIETALPRAIAVELIQAASLLHDDFVDQDTIRRNEQATWTLEGARRAVLLGDVIFASAIKMMSDLGREEGTAISNAIAQVARGAVQEPLDPQALLREIESDRFDSSIYEKIISLKTGNLFGAACRLGAIAAGADKELQKRSERYGLRVGEAYQIADDIQDIERLIKERSVSARQMVFLAPACLYFAKDTGHHLLAFWKEASSVPRDSLIECFKIVVERMKEEIERRLQSAVSEIDTGFQQNEFSRLARRAPWDLIKMFNGS